jgi:hypothetical protein
MTSSTEKPDLTALTRNAYPMPNPPARCVLEPTVLGVLFDHEGREIPRDRAPAGDAGRAEEHEADLLAYLRCEAVAEGTDVLR